MKDFVIIGDSTADLDRNLREKYNIDYVPMNYVVDNTEYVASLDWESHSARQFYDLMRNGKRILTTQVPREVYEEKFSECLKQGKDAVYIACSSALSGSINLAKIISEEMKEKYPHNKIICIDSLCSSLGQGYMLIKASLLRSEGKGAAEVAEYIENNKLCVNQFGTTGSLEYLRRAGRVKASSAFFGNMLGIKPIIISDRIGQNYAIEKVKGAVNVKEKIAQHISETVSPDNLDCLYISHADCIEDAELLKDKILSKTPFKNVIIGTIGPIVGSCVGPGTIISFCFGKEVTITGSEK